MKLIKKQFSEKRIMFFLFFFVSTYFFGQRYSYKEINNVPDFVQKFKEKKEFKKNLRLGEFVKAVNYLPKNYVKNGTIDYTHNLQKAIDENLNVIMPNFPILINDFGLDIRDNQNILFKKKSRLILKASSKKKYEVIRIHNRKDVKIFSPKIIGDRDRHIGGNGEWGMGISIRGSHNVKIINANISKCWGDGVYIGTLARKGSSNILLSYGLIDKNRRNGISVINVKGLIIHNIIVSNTKGTNPQAGIDLEPNNNNEELKDILIDNVYTFNNFNQGIFFCLNQLNGNENHVNIRVKNHMDNSSKVALGLMNLIPEKYSLLPVVTGSLEIENIRGINNTTDLRVFKNSNFEKIKVIVKKSVNEGEFKIKGTTKNIIIK